MDGNTIKESQISFFPMDSDRRGKGNTMDGNTIKESQISFFPMDSGRRGKEGHHTRPDVSTKPVSVSLIPNS